MRDAWVSSVYGNLSEVMINKSDASDVKPFTGLSPDVVLDAATSVGLDVDGRLFALNSYENRVYQLGSPHGSLVLKFYRPERWTDEQIGEEHQFTAEMAAAELPVAAPEPKPQTDAPTQPPLVTPTPQPKSWFSWLWPNSTKPTQKTK